MSDCKNVCKLICNIGGGKNYLGMLSTLSDCRYSFVTSKGKLKCAFSMFRSRCKSSYLFINIYIFIVDMKDTVLLSANLKGLNDQVPML
jgi:hypothetical protein